MPSTGRGIQLHNCLKYARRGCVVISDGIQKYCAKCVESQGELTTEVLLTEVSLLSWKDLGTERECGNMD
jgi:hypothetical protein